MQEPNSNTKAQNTESVTPTPATAQKVDNEHMIPKTRLDEVIQQRNAKDKLNEDLQAKLDAYEKVKADDEVAKLTAQSKFEELYNAEKVKNEAANSALAEKEAAMVVLEAKRVEDTRDNNLLQLLKNAHNPKRVLANLKLENADSVVALLVDGKFNDEAATKLISEFASANAYLFKSMSQGSPSNSGGRMPNPSSKQMEDEQKKIQDKRGKW